MRSILYIMNLLKPHLCVPMGLVVNNTRDFILDSLDDADADETPLSVVSEPMMDFMYNNMIIGRPKKHSKRITKKRVYKK